MDAPAIVALVALAGAALWVAYQHGHTLGFWDGCDVEATRWKERLEHLRRERAVERDAGDKLVAHCARQRLRLRGTLREARRWKAVAVGLGWRRTGAASGCRACGNGCVTCALAGAMRAVAAGLSVPSRRRWTTVADGIPPVAAPEPVEPTMVILPPQESPEAAERMATAVRKLLGEAFDGGAKGGGA